MDWAELLNWNEYSKLLIGLLSLTDPLAATPIYLSLTKQFEQKQQRRVASLTAFSFIAILLFHVFLGPELLSYFGITIGAFRVAGGILLLLIGIDMMRKDPGMLEGASPNGSHPTLVALIPLAVPLTAGPGAISAVIVYSHREESLGHLLLVSIVVLSIGLLLWLSLRFAGAINALVGETGMQVFHRIMGLIVTAIGVEFILDGVAMHFPDLFHFQGD